MTMTFNSARIIRRRDTIFIALPAASQVPIAGGCNCEYCKAHPDKTPMWDVLALSNKLERNDRTWMVHMPEFR